MRLNREVARRAASDNTEGVCLCPHCVASRTAWSGTIDKAVLDAARERIGVRQPVNVVVAPVPGSPLAAGATAEPVNGVHEVRIHPLVGEDAASFVLLHELAHCAQRERLGGAEKFDRLYLSANHTYGYDDNPFEVQANLVAAGLEAEFAGVVA